MLNKKLFLLLVIIAITLVLWREGGYRQIYKKHYVNESENISYIHIETISNYPDSIIPVGNPVFIKLKLTNIGPGESPSFLIKLRLCEPSVCEAEKVTSEADVPERYKLRVENLSRGRSEITSEFGFRVSNSGFHRFYYELEPIGPPSRCGFYWNECQASWSYENQNFYSFQVVSLSEYNSA